MPAGAATPGAGPAAGKRRLGSWIGQVVIVLVLVGAIGVPALLGYLEDRRWKVGACLDYYPTSFIELDVDAHVVDCSDSAAKSRIVGIAEPDASCESQGWLASITRESKTYCLIQA